MTPERRAYIEQLAKSLGAPAYLEELLTDNDTLTAENDRLEKRCLKHDEMALEVISLTQDIERLKGEQNNMIRFEHCQGCGAVLQPDDVDFSLGWHTVPVADEHGDAMPAQCGPTVLHEYGQVQCVALEVEKRKLADELATLRASLTALVTAGEKVRDIWQNEGMYEGFDESVATLSAALAAAKGKVGG